MIDDDFAKSLGLESLEQLRETVKQRLEQDRSAASRLKLKRALLDSLNADHDFELPPTLVDNEFQAIWRQVTERPRAVEAELRGRRHDRGEGESRVSRHRRAPRPARPDPVRGRLPQQDRGLRRRGQPRAARAGPPISGTGAEGLRLLPQQPASAGGNSRAALRGQGGRLHPGARAGEGEAGDRGRALRRRGRRPWPSPS